MGEDYTEESISERIRITVAENGISKRPQRDINELNSKYYDRLYEVSELVKQNKKAAKKYNRKLPYSVQNDFTVYTLAQQLAIINREHITSLRQLKGKMESAKEAYRNTKTELNKLIANQEQFETVLDHCEKFFALKNKKELTPAEQVKLKIYTQTVERVHITDKADIESIRSLINSTKKKIDILTANFRSIENQYKTYDDIINTYYEISKGDYISKLVEEERNRQNHEKDNYKKDKSI